MCRGELCILEVIGLDSVDGKVNHRVLDNVSAKAGVVVMERIMPLKPSFPPMMLCRHDGVSLT